MIKPRRRKIDALYDVDDPRWLRIRGTRTMPSAEAVQAMMKYNEELKTPCEPWRPSPWIW
jgi:hypothetical protein